MPALAALVDLVLPRRCVGCGGVLGPLCPTCIPEAPVLRARAAGVEVCAAAGYDGAVRAALLAYKERGRRDLAGPLAALLARAVLAAAGGRSPPAGAVLVPVPSARAVAAARGGDHVLRLARRAAVITGLRCARDAVALSRSVRDSAGLDPAQRAANVASAMIAAPAPPGVVAMVVDDIVTTGSTVREARRALTEAGWPVAGCAVVAATRLRSGGGLGYPLAAPSDTG